MPLSWNEIKTRASIFVREKAGGQTFEAMVAPSLFRDKNHPDSFVVIPHVSSETRKYIPIGFFDHSSIVGVLTEKQTGEIEKAAQSVLNTRLLFPNSSLEDLYDPIAMPPALTKAHQRLDKVVEVAYGRTFTDYSQRVTYLFELYQKLNGELFVETLRKPKREKETIKNEKT